MLAASPSMPWLKTTASKQGCQQFFENSRVQLNHQAWVGGDPTTLCSRDHEDCLSQEKVWAQVAGYTECRSSLKTSRSRFTLLDRTLLTVLRKASIHRVGRSLPYSRLGSRSQGTLRHLLVRGSLVLSFGERPQSTRDVHRGRRLVVLQLG